MKIVVQRVSKASCSIHNQLISSIDHGFLLLVGICEQDTLSTMDIACKKVANLRVFEDQQGKMNLSILDISGEILSISQFTLCADTTGGNRPSFTKAMKPDVAKELFDRFCHTLLHTYHIPTKTGVFGEHMEIELINDGPVTIIYEF
jgi:D-tyrosyl-tRNA(Tyr) deacylase